MREKKTTLTKNFTMEKASIGGFCAFCKNNIPLVIAVSLMLFFTYGIKLIWYSIGNDTEVFMADRDGMSLFFMQIGRFGLVLLQNLWRIKEFNPFTAFLAAFCLIWFFTISWCYIIAIFSGRGISKCMHLIPFALVFMTAPVWAEQFYYLHQTAEVTLIIALCPYVIYLFYKGFLDNENGKIICAVVLLVFMISVYQAIVPLFCCGVFACFVLLEENSNCQPRVYRNLCLKLFAGLIIALALYFFIDRVIVPAFFHIERANYLDNMNTFGQRSPAKHILQILLFGYTITLGNIPLVQNIVNPVFLRYAQAGTLMVEQTAAAARELGNVLLLPAGVLFLVGITASARRKISSGQRLLYMLAGIGVPLCIFIMTIIAGRRPQIRTLFVLPFASAFMFFYLIKSYKKQIGAAVACFVLLVAVHQAQITAQLFYSDKIRYDEDVRFAIELDRLITQAQPGTEKLPVALAGGRLCAARMQANFIQGEVIGHSFFEGGAVHLNDATERGLGFMNTLGIYYEPANTEQVDQAFEEAAQLPAYPNPGCVKRVHDFIVVRISDNLFDK